MLLCMMAAAGRPVRALAGALLLPLLASCAQVPAEPLSGVARDLADRRARTISGLAYSFHLRIPEDPGAPIRGSATIDLTWTDPDGEDLILDLELAEDRVEQVRVGGRAVEWRAAADHVVVPAEHLTPHGSNRVEVDFVSPGGDGVLRHPEFVYTLFVPDRAHTLLPLFDQPDLKGTVRWEIDAPRGWEVVTNGVLAEREQGAATERWTFEASRPISTYLMAFTAGRFDVVEGTRRGRTYRLMHLGVDADRLDRSAGAVFDLHARSLAWMEAYTGVDYPFEKFDMIAIPDLVYGGMEHPGVVLYREGDLLPAGEIARADQVRRTEIIAHESAHMWFGNLVTMARLDDLWMKEVFAEHFATRVVREVFPEDDHDLRFLLTHRPMTSRADPAGGTRPIRAVVANRPDGLDPSGPGLNRRAPIALANLERFVSPDTFRDGVREMMRRHAWRTAGWDEFLTILEPLHGADLSGWSRTWVERVGRPVIDVVWEPGRGDRGAVVLVQEGGQAGEPPWPQRMTVYGEWAGRTESSTVEFGGDRGRVTVWENVARPDVVIPNASGLEYGNFRLDRAWTVALLHGLGDIRPSLLRGSATLVLEDALVDARLSPDAVIEAGLSALRTEGHDLVATRLVHLIGSTWQDHLSDEHGHPLDVRIREAFGDRIARSRARALHARVAAGWQRTLLERRAPFEHAVDSGRGVPALRRVGVSAGPIGRVARSTALLRDGPSGRGLTVEPPVVRLRPR